MEMNFPHNAQRKYAETTTSSYGSVLDAARARQAKSRTVRALRNAEHGHIADGDDLVARIQCFAAEPDAEVAVRGSFWQKTETSRMDEQPVYQSASANSKEQLCIPTATGNEFNPAGHGADKKS